MKAHESEPVLSGGAALRDARAAVVLIHGRGGAAQDILSLGLTLIEGIPAVALLAPQAPGRTWYPQRFLAPLSQNEPALTSALAVLTSLIARVGDAGIPPERVALLGFSQGACVALEFAARNPRRYGAIIALSGAVIGPPGTVRTTIGNLAGTPVYLGCSNRDFHIPEASVHESAEVLAALGARVQTAIFPGLGHTVNAAEAAAAQALIQALA
jgi:predicted esterase